MSLFDCAFSALDEAIIIHDGKRIHWCTDNAAMLGEYESSSELIGQKVLMYISNEFRYRAVKSLEETNQNGRSGGMYKIVTKNGRYKSIRTSSSRFTHEGKLFYVGVIREIEEDEIDERAWHIISTMRHETMTPISNALGNVDLILEAYGDGISENVRRSVKIIKRNLLRLKECCDKIITLENVLVENHSNDFSK